MCYIKDYIKKQDKRVNYLVSVSINITNTNPQKDSIIGICLMKYDLETMKCINKIDTKLKPHAPEISLKSYLHCGLTLNDLKDAPRWMDIADTVIDMFGGDDTAIVGYNVRYLSIPFIYNEMVICGKKIDFTKKVVLDIKDFQDATGVYFFDMETMVSQCHLFDSSIYNINYKTLSGQSKACVCIAEKMLKNNVQPDIMPVIDNSGMIMKKRMHNTAFDALNGTIQTVFTKGKYFGVPVEMVASADKGYIQWCISNVSNLSVEAKEIFRKDFGVV